MHYEWVVENLLYRHVYWEAPILGRFAGRVVIQEQIANA